jgi:hypothetical protein
MSKRELQKRSRISRRTVASRKSVGANGKTDLHRRVAACSDTKNCVLATGTAGSTVAEDKGIDAGAEKRRDLVSEIAHDLDPFPCVCGRCGFGPRM